MVAFTYSRTADQADIQQKITQLEQARQNIVESDAASQDSIAAAQRDIALATRQLEMSYQGGVVDTAAYIQAQNQLAAASTDIQAKNTVQQAEIQARRSEAAVQTADQALRSAPKTTAFSYTSEDFTAPTSEAAEAAARENARAQAAIQFGSDNYNVNHFDTRVRVLPGGGYTAYTVAHGFGQDQVSPPNPVTPEEERRIVNPPVRIEDDVVPIPVPNIADPRPLDIEALLPETIVVSVPDRPAIEPEKNDDNGDDESVVVDVSLGRNALHEYSTYTYGLSLHYMTIKEYNAFITGKVQYSPKQNRVIIASGGRRNSTLVRNKNFEHDMYIGDYKLTTIISNNAKTRGTNSVIMDFVIYEPISATLIERLVALARENDIQSWVEMPLILQIDFFAQDENGNYLPSPIEGLTKYICIKLVDIKFEFSNKGAEYRCTAVPFSHQAFNKTSITIPANFEITAKTVGEFFKASTNTDYVSVPDGGQARDEYSIEYAMSGNRQPKGYVALSLPDALNEYQRSLTKPTKGRKHQETADEYYFVLDQEIADAKIFVPEKHNLSLSPTQNDVTNRVQGDNVDINRGVVPINAGSNIIEVINSILRSSEYYRKNIQAEKAAESDPQNTKPIQIHKIVPKVEFTDEWDGVRKAYRRKITYHIQKYEYHNDKNPNARRSLPKVFDRYYDYIYTGKNQDVRDMKIEFNVLWFQALTAFESRFERDNLNIVDDPLTYSEGLDLSGSRPAAASSKRTNTAQTFPYRTFPVSLNQANQQISDGSKKSAQAVDLWNSIFNYRGGDMVNLTLEIAGDPAWIKQDDIWFPPSARTTPVDNNSIATDKRQVFIYVNFRLPDDIDLNSGLYSKSEYNSSFSGIYGVVQVENIFRDGLFYQKLNCYRLFNQEKYRASDRPSSSYSEGQRSSSDELGLAVSSDDLDAEYNQAALRAYEDNQLAAANSSNSEDQDRPTTTAFSEYRDWSTTDVVNVEDYPGA